VTGTRLLPDARSASGRHRRDWLAITVSLVSLGGVVWWALKQQAPDFPTSGREIALIAAAVLAYVPITVARGWRWHRILRRAGIPHDPVDAYALVPVGYMGNTVLPARGGELLRIVLLARRSTARRREILGSILAERLLDAIVLLALFVTMTWAGVAGAPTGQAPANIAVGVAALAAVAAGGFLAISRRRSLSQRLTRLLDTIRPVGRASRLLIGLPGLVLLAATAAVWLAEGVMYLLIGESLHLGLGFLEATFLVVIASFFSMLPAAPGYVGTFDAAILFGLGGLDVAGSDALAFVLLVRFVFFIPVTVVGLVLAFTRYGGLKGIKSVLRVRVSSAEA
jgi:uncharacterized membrane protein YbhN (UPF0104 family)